MKNLKPKIEKVLVNTINQHYADLYKAYLVKDKIMTEYIEEDLKQKWPPEQWFFVPEYDHEEEFCFTCDGGPGWDAMNPDESDYPCYGFEEALSKNMKEAGLFYEPYASWKFVVTEAA